MCIRDSVSMLPTMPGILKLVRYSVGEMRPMVATALPALDWFSGRPACPRRPHCPRCPTHNTHTHNHTIAATAAVSAPGGAAGTQRSSGAEGDWRRRVRRVQRAPASRANRSRRRWQQQRRATSSSASRCRYEYGNDDGRLHQGKGSARASHPEAGPAHIRATSLPLSVPRRSLLSRSYLGWGVVPPFSSWRVFAEGAACG